jgi:endonuclease/exonuclease/phosphatase family metal-dependent hydrolase
MPLMRLLTWNTQADRHPKWKPALVRQRLAAYNADVICLTEGHPGYLPPDGHAYLGVPAGWRHDVLGSRKVLLWSREPLQYVDHVGDAALPPGRFLAGDHPTGLRVVGLCVPYGGYRDAQHTTNFAAHLHYSATFATKIRPQLPRSVVVMGDYNLPMGVGFSMRGYNRRAQQQLQAALHELHIITATTPDPDHQRGLIDHIALSETGRVKRVITQSRTFEGRQLSDHPLIVADIELQL